MNQRVEKSSSHDRDFPGIVRNEFIGRVQGSLTKDSRLGGQVVRRLPREREKQDRSPPFPLVESYQ